MIGRRALALAACLLPVAPVMGRVVDPAAMAARRAAPFADHQRRCAGKDGWSDPAPAIRLHGNVYHVGTCGIVVLLIVGAKGSILIDSGPKGAVPTVLANLHRLGLAPTDVKLLLTSHEHVDHVGGLEDLRRATGATVAATAAARPLLESGTPAADDPQRTVIAPYRGVRVGRLVRDGETLALGDLRLTVHATPGHSPGGTSWSWRACRGRRCPTIVYADSLSAASADGYRFTDHPAVVARLRATIARVAGWRCDILVTPHPAAGDLYARLAGDAPLVDPRGCARYAAIAIARLDARLVAERRSGRGD